VPAGTYSPPLAFLERLALDAPEHSRGTVAQPAAFDTGPPADLVISLRCLLI
jgi:hypothetical protein